MSNPTDRSRTVLHSRLLGVLFAVGLALAQAGNAMANVAGGNPGP